MSEANDLTKFILTFFFEHRIFACRHGVAAGSAQYTNKEGDTKSRYFRAGITGAHDVFVWLPPDGKFLGVEIKIGKDRLRPEQEGFISNITRMGALSMVVHSREDFLNKITPIIKSLSYGIPAS